MNEDGESEVAEVVGVVDEVTEVIEVEDTSGDEELNHECSDGCDHDHDEPATHEIPKEISEYIEKKKALLAEKNKLKKLRIAKGRAKSKAAKKSRKKNRK